MTNKELLRKILADKPILIEGLYEINIIHIIQIIKKTFNIKENGTSLWNGVDKSIFRGYQYLYYDTKSRTIKKYSFNKINTFNYLKYDKIKKLSKLLDEEFNIKKLIDDR